MPFSMKMPDIATNDSPIRIVRWLIKPGDSIERGQPLLEAETDKATVTVESAVSGTLRSILGTEGAEVAVGETVAIFQLDGPATSEEAAHTGIVSETSQPPVVTRLSADHLYARRPGPGKGLFARNRAAAGAVKAPPEGTPLSIAERTAATRLLSSKQTIPHFYVQTSFDASAIVRCRGTAASGTLAWDAFFVQAIARSIRRFDRFRCRLDGERLVPADTDAIGVAVDADGELFVAPIVAPTTKTLEQITEEVRLARDRLHSGEPDARRTRSALMTISNLGAANVENFIPIINPPEPAILGVGRIALTPVARDDGQIIAQHRGTITLCVDHRVANGKYAADFLSAIVKELETFEP